MPDVFKKYSAALIYLAIVSLISVIITIKDKSAAKKDRRRTPEKTLLLFSALGGSVAMYITMKAIKHKTQHKKFMIGIPVIMALQIIVLLVLAYYDII